MKRLWTGIVNLSVAPNTTANRIYTMLAEGEGDALNRMLSMAKESHPGSPVTGSGAWQVPDELVKDAAALLG